MDITALLLEKLANEYELLEEFKKQMNSNPEARQAVRSILLNISVLAKEALRIEFTIQEHSS